MNFVYVFDQSGREFILNSRQHNSTSKPDAVGSQLINCELTPLPD